ncbi:Hpt domain-containing protein [Marinomonas polaris]|uniref:Hpt domain-containing protein n=1 Tax=Marinomonas polaris DSM 16579 TaxID=1122206 RepID=A0A1M5B249_9GAMM|nr:Hpt domain-containing protein [Marinomonas polaris]SHF36427.1 Hpt domain-containing protein [Marinomonas polaris DSM 16579]|tara:strand:- start:1250 stop:1582 length:333 start_codon:yes stop_codon:yes gene_type:complete
MIDHDHLDSLIQLLGKDTINTIRLEFVDDSNEKMAQLMQAWEKRDHQELKQVSHSLKSASLNMAMQIFAKQCQLIETAATQHSEQGMQTIIDGLPAIHQASLDELEAYFL